MTQDQALTVLRSRRHALLRWRWSLWLGALATVIVGLWVWLPRPYGLDLGPLSLFLAALLFAGLGVLATHLAWITDGSSCRDVDSLAPAVVVAGGAEGVAVRLEGAGRTDERGRRWWWQFVRGQRPVPVGQRVWVDANLHRGRPSPIVWLGDGAGRPRVLWPVTTPTQDGGTRVRLEGVDGRPITPGEPAPAQILAAARRSARKVAIRSALWIGLVAVMAVVGIALDLSASESESGSTSGMIGVPFVLALVGALTLGGPRLVTAGGCGVAAGCAGRCSRTGAPNPRSPKTLSSPCSSTRPTARRPRRCGGGRCSPDPRVGRACARSGWSTPPARAAWRPCSSRALSTASRSSSIPALPSAWSPTRHSR